MTEPRKIKSGAVPVGIFGLIMIAVGIWAMVAPYEIHGISVVDSNAAGDSPKIAVSAGVISVIVAGSCFCVHLDDKKYRRVITFLLVLIVALSISAMSIGIKNINQIAKINVLQQFEQFLTRLRAVAIVSGISAIVQIVEMVIVGLSLRQMRA